MRSFNVIYAHKDCDLEKVFFTQQLLIAVTGHCCVINSQDKPSNPRLHWYYIGEDTNYIDFWNKLLKLFIPDKSFNFIVQLHGDLNFGDWNKFFLEFHNSFKTFQWGIYSPFVVQSKLYPPIEFEEYPGGYRSIKKADNIIWAISRKVIDNSVREFNQNDNVLNYFNTVCVNSCLPIILDYNVWIDSPITIEEYEGLSNRSYFSDDLIYSVYQDYYINGVSELDLFDVNPELNDISLKTQDFKWIENKLYKSYNEYRTDYEYGFDEFKEKFYPVNKYDYKPTESDLLLVTSISPHDYHIESQNRALKTWANTGLKIISVNNREEIDVLRDLYPNVDNWVEHHGHKAPEIQSLVNISINLDKPILIINSDIEIFLNAPLELVPSIGIRNNYDRYYNKASLESYGIDVFLLTPEISEKLCYQFLKIGSPFWDWSLTFDLIELCDVKQITYPIFFHKNHPLNWNKSTHKKNMSDLIASNKKYNIDWDHFRFNVGYKDVIRKGLY